MYKSTVLQLCVSRIGHSYHRNLVVDVIQLYRFCSENGFFPAVTAHSNILCTVSLCFFPFRFYSVILLCCNGCCFRFICACNGRLALRRCLLLCFLAFTAVCCIGSYRSRKRCGYIVRLLTRFIIRNASLR